jgi:hypothetical protein
MNQSRRKLQCAGDTLAARKADHHINAQYLLIDHQHRNIGKSTRLLCYVMDDL